MTGHSRRGTCKPCTTGLRTGLGTPGFAPAGELGVLCVARDRQLPKTTDRSDLQGQGESGARDLCQAVGFWTPEGPAALTMQTSPTLPQDATGKLSPESESRLAGTVRESSLK